MGYSPWSRKESDMTERLSALTHAHTHTHTHTHTAHMLPFSVQLFMASELAMEYVSCGNT